MKSILYSRYGPPEVVQLADVDKPIPNDHEVLIRVRAASVNAADWHCMRGKPYLLRLLIGLRTPTIRRLGLDVAGHVEAIGASVTQFKPGDAIVGWCRGAFAEYACAAESSLVRKPASVTFEQAAAVPSAAVTALQALRDKGRIHAGKKVLINGAAGGVGTFAVQIAKAFGADVTGVCSTRNVEMVRSIGADHVIDYQRDDFTETRDRYDLILDSIGNHSLSACRRIMNPAGIYIVNGGPDNRWIGPVTRGIRAVILSTVVSQQLVMFLTKKSHDDLSLMVSLMEEEKVSPIIDRVYGLNQVADAIRYVEEGHARGKVAITVAPA